MIVANRQAFHDARRMKAYGIFPAFELRDPNDHRVRHCLSLITAMIVDRLRAGGDASHHVIDWRDPGSPPWQGWTDSIAEPHLIPLPDEHMLFELVRMSLDPFLASSAGVIRSLITCRAVTFGHNGQAFLCLRHEDEPPVSQDPDLVIVEERSELLADTDYFDGWLGAAQSDERHWPAHVRI